MRALRAIVLLALCAFTVATWFHREPVRRTHSSMRATGSTAMLGDVPASVDEFLPLKAVERVHACLGLTPQTMTGLMSIARERVGRELPELLEWRLVSFEDFDGNRFRVAWRREKDGLPRLSFHAQNPEETWEPLPLPPGTPELDQLLEGKIILSDVSSRVFRGARGKSWRLETENGSTKAVEIREAALHLRCTASYGPAACDCQRGATY